jgi:predicted dehydrogenase
MTAKPINTCVLGLGLAGLTFHVPFVIALPRQFTLHSVLERNPQSPGGKVHDRFGITTKIHRTLDEALNDADIELIIVATPSETHYALAKAALQAGKHGGCIVWSLQRQSANNSLKVLVDKPVTATAEQAEELGALAKSKSLVLYAFQNRRWDQEYLALRHLLALPDTSPQSLGTVLEFESVWMPAKNPCAE